MTSAAFFAEVTIKLWSFSGSYQKKPQDDLQSSSIISGKSPETIELK